MGCPFVYSCVGFKNDFCLISPGTKGSGFFPSLILLYRLNVNCKSSFTSKHTVIASSLEIYSIKPISLGSIEVKVLIKSLRVSLFSPGCNPSIISLVKLMFPLTIFISVISFWYLRGRLLMSFAEEVLYCGLEGCA